MQQVEFWTYTFLVVSSLNTTKIKPPLREAELLFVCINLDTGPHSLANQEGHSNCLRKNMEEKKSGNKDMLSWEDLNLTPKNLILDNYLAAKHLAKCL